MAIKIIRQPDAGDIETLAYEAQALADLSLWINEARGLIDRLRMCAAHDPALAERLAANQVSYLSPDWEEDQVCGMTYFVLYQRSLAGEILETALAMQRPQTPPATPRSKNALGQALVRPEVQHTE